MIKKSLHNNNNKPDARSDGVSLRHAERGERDGMPRTSWAISHPTRHGWSRALRELYMLVPCMCCIAHDARRQAQGMHIDGHGSAQHGPCAPSKHKSGTSARSPARCAPPCQLDELGSLAGSGPRRQRSDLPHTQGHVSRPDQLGLLQRCAAS